MTDEQLLIRIGAKITNIRKSKGYTVIHLANLCEMEKSNLIPIEKGRKNATTLTLHRIAKALNVKIKDLFEIE